MPSAKRLYPEGEGRCYMWADNDPKHTSRLAQDFIEVHVNIYVHVDVNIIIYKDVDVLIVYICTELRTQNSMFMYM